MISTDETNFPNNSSLTYRQLASLPKAGVNSSSKDIKLSRTHIFKIIETSLFLSRILRPLMKVRLLLMKSVPQKNIMVWNDKTNNIKQKNERYYEKK